MKIAKHTSKVRYNNLHFFTVFPVSLGTLTSPVIQKNTERSAPTTNCRHNRNNKKFLSATADWLL
jgi:hypothetical protein